MYDPIDESYKPSKTEYKKTTARVAKFVTSLCRLSTNQLSKLGLPEDALVIIEEAKKMKASGARNRHLKTAINILLNDLLWSHPDSMNQYDKVSLGHKGLEKLHLFDEKHGLK
jgi:ribosomal 50S subunit-associated protein YjgA (DUF615 family)